MKILNYNEIRFKEDKKEKVKKFIIIAGAGISIDEPTKLPNGNDLLQYYMDITIGKECRDSLTSRWRTISKLTQNPEWQVEGIRLEFIIGQIDEVDQELNCTRLISGFESFNNMMSNTNHELLIQLINSGHIVITPNFDNMIESASNTLYKNDICYGIHTSSMENGKKVYHYHGISDDYNDMGATIKNIKKGLPEEFKRRIIDWFEEGYSLVMVGFSCSDFFDITPFFDNLSYNMKKENRKFEGTAIYFDHSLKGNMYECSSLLKSKVKRHCDMFKSYEIWHGDTNLFLKDLLGNDYIETNCEYNDKISNKNWNYKFHEISSKITKEQQIMYIVKILNNIGMNFEDSWFKEGHFLEEYINKENVLDFVAQFMLNRNIEKHIQEKYFDDKNKSVITDIKSLYGKNNYFSKKYYNICKEYDKVDGGMHVQMRAKKMKYKHFVHHITKSNVSLEAFSSEYVNGFLIIVKREISKYIIGVQKGKQYKKLCVLNQCGEKMKELHFSQYMYMSYYNTITYGTDLLREILFQNSTIEDNEKQNVTLFLEMCSAGMLPLLYMQSAKLYAIRYIYLKNEKYKEYAKEKIHTAETTSEQLGNINIDRRIVALRNRINGLNCSKSCEPKKIVEILYL